MDINSEDETSYSTLYLQAFLNYVENEYCAKHRQMYLIRHDHVLGSNLFPSPKASGFRQSSLDPYYLSHYDEKYLTHKWVAETTPAWSDRTSHLLTDLRLYSNSLPDAITIWGLVDRCLNDYHSDPMESSRTFGLPDITEWWGQQ